MTQASENTVTAIGAEEFAADADRASVEVAADVKCPKESAVPKTVQWIGPIPSSSHGVMAVVGDDGYLIPLWTAGDMLRACKVYWHSINS